MTVTHAEGAADLARRAAAWLPGMVGISPTGVRVRLTDPDAPVGVSGDLPPEYRPDLDDPATLGCLEHLARKAWGEDYLIEVVIEWADVAWIEVVRIEPRDGSAEPRTFGDSGRAEAWVAALEAAPWEREDAEANHPLTANPDWR